MTLHQPRREYSAGSFLDLSTRGGQCGTVNNGYDAEAAADGVEATESAFGSMRA